jgi:hypothetical protein
MLRTFARTWYTLGILAAFLIPAGTALAANEPEFTYPTGTRLFAKPESPVLIQGTNVSLVSLTRPAGTSIGGCDSFGITGSLEQNTGSLIEAKISSATFGTCTTSEGSFTITTTGEHGTPWCLKSSKELATDQFRIFGGACNTAPRAITLVMGKCTYNRSEPMTGTFKTEITGVENQDALLSLTNIEFVKEEVFCSGPTTTVLDNINLTMELDKSSFAEPVYLS